MAEHNYIYKLGFIGFGFMGKNLLTGFLQASIVDPKNTICYDIFREGLKKDLTASKYSGVKMAITLDDVIKGSDIIFFAVKPDIIPEILNKVAWDNYSPKIIISIAAGVTLLQIEERINRSSNSSKGHSVFRVMPNQCISVMAGICALSRGKCVIDAEESIVFRLLSSVGLCKIVEEKYIDIVTAVSGSGPAYMFMMLDALGTAGATHGLTKSDALELAAHTMMGAAKMYLETKSHPCQLIDSVCSPGGTTLRGVARLKESGFEHAVLSAVDGAYKRAQELSRL